MLKLKTLLQQHNLTQAALARELEVSEAMLAQIVNHNQWPKQDTPTLKARIQCWLGDQGVNARDCFNKTGGVRHEQRPELDEEETMLLKKQVLLPATKKHFGLFRAPFDDNAVQGHEDVFLTPESRYVREALYQTARYGGFIAVIGESGLGKSTLRRDLIDRINKENSPVVVIEPYVLAMEDNDHQGKTLKAASLAEAIVHTLAPLEKLKRSPEAHFRQLHRVLKESNRAGYSHVLVIEEAHSLPIPTLKHLKRFFELEDGFKKLLSIVLLGQPELGDKLSERLLAVREVVQRCEVIDLPPLDDHLADFLDFKFKRVGADINKIVGSDAIPALRQHLSWLRPKKDTPVISPGYRQSGDRRHEPGRAKRHSGYRRQYYSQCALKEAFMLNPAVTIKNPSVMTYQAIQQQFRQCLSVMNNLSQEGFTVSQFTVDGYSRPTITLLHDRRCDALHKKGQAVRYALGTDHQGRWEKYQFLQDNCRITWEVR